MGISVISYFPSVSLGTTEQTHKNSSLLYLFRTTDLLNYFNLSNAIEGRITEKEQNR